jgi:hypothetical protein
MPQKLLTAFFLCSILILPQLSLAQPAAPNSTVPDSFYNTPPTIDPTEAVITKGGFVPCSGVGCSACDFVVMANTITKWLIGISFIFFAVLCVIAGTKMITSGGNPSALTDAKKSLTNAFIGLIIIMAAWLAVDTLLRGLLKGNNGQIEGYGPWSQVQCAKQAQSSTQNLGFDQYVDYWPGDPNSPLASGDTPPPPFGGTAAGSCTGGSCSAITIPCANSRSCSISPDMVSRLAGMHSAAGVNGARVTEAMPPTRTHRSRCHNNGTCVDYSRAGGMGGAEVARVISAAQSNGLRAVYEVQTQAQKNALVSAGAPAASILVLGTHISAPHFSIYGY